MSRSFKGEISIELDGVTYTLRLDLNAFAAFEDETGKAALEWAETLEAGKARVGDMITMLHCTMLRHHADASRQLAGDILSEDPELVMRLIAASAPKAREVPTRGKTRAGKRSG